MNKPANELAHKFPHLNTPNLRNEIERTNAKVVAIQRSKDHHKQRATLSELQGTLHRMRLELRRREEDEKRSRIKSVDEVLKGNLPEHCITPGVPA